MSSMFSKPKAPKPDQSLIDAQKKREAKLAKEEATQQTELDSRKRAARALRYNSQTLFADTGVKGVSNTLGG